MVSNWKELPALSNNNTRIMACATILHEKHNCSWDRAMKLTHGYTVQQQLHVINSNPTFKF